MNYDFSGLSHSEFEDLARDLVGREIDLRFEAFPAGPDDGMGGRHARADGSIVMQAKHYHGSGFAALKSKMAKERLSIDRLAATRYILVTSAPLTPKNKNALAQIIGPSLQTPGDIFGPATSTLCFENIRTTRKPIKRFGRRAPRFWKRLSRKRLERLCQSPGWFPQFLPISFRLRRLPGMLRLSRR
ncbi:hypothetical protein [Bradyrhizobium murdochi]|uniref:hypothetical protein n=1 Tax=Bradyrhizobium murdochi TaxID=1038859 RepID=UPI0032216EBD